MLHLRTREPLMEVQPQVEQSAETQVDSVMKKKMHKNVSELKFSLLFKGLYQTKIIAHKIMGENTTAIFCVKKMNHTLCLKNRNFAIYGRRLLGC